MSEFTLEEWEQAIEMPSPFKSAVWESARLQFRFVLAKRDKWVLFVREKNQLHSPHWLVLNSSGLMPQFYSSKTPLKTWERLEDDWPHVARGYFFAWPRARCIVLEEGHGYWLDSKLQTSQSFFLEFERRELTNGGARWQRVQQEFQDKNSDLSFAYRSRNVPYTTYEQFSLLYESRSQYEEIDTVTRFVLMKAIENVRARGARWSISCHTNDTSVWVYDADQMTQNQVKSSLAAWSRFLEEFTIPLTQPRRDRHFSLQQNAWLKDFSLAVDVEAGASAHERLETRLFVREWLQQNAPDRIDLLKDVER